MARNIYSTVDGSFQRFKPETIKAPANTTDGYWSVKLCKNGKNVTICIHILVARAFVPNPLNLPEVNHKDTNRKNNKASNLEWCTHHENVLYSAKLGRYKRYGEQNPNYGNKKLKEFYKEHPEARKNLARPGAQNGRCVPLQATNISTNKTLKFAYLRECAKFLIEANLTSSKIDSVANNIKKYMDSGIPYKGFIFSHLQ